MNLFKRVWTYLFNRIEHNPIVVGDEGLGGGVPAPTRVDVHSAQGDRKFEIIGGDRARDLPAGKRAPAASTKANSVRAKPKNASRKKQPSKAASKRKKTS